MPHDPALDAHEHSEHATHAAHSGDPFVARVAITVAVLAVVAAGATSLETIEASLAITASSEAVLAQERATDSWNEYQADSLKRHLYGLAADQGGLHAEDYRRIASKQLDAQSGIRVRAKREEDDRDRLARESAGHEHRHHWLTASATAVEIGIALSTVAIITGRRPFWYAALGLGAAGLALGLAAFA